MKHPDWPAFVAAIVADPDDDTVRLVAADFLDENGDPHRAAFIRIQCELARLESANLVTSPEAKDLRNKEWTYTSAKSDHLPLWALEECPELVRMASRGPGLLGRIEGAEQLRWRRGFIGAVGCPATDWLRHGVTVRSRNPVRRVILSGIAVPTRDEWYTGLPALRGLTFVWIENADEEFLIWLREWLPGTKVQEVPF